MTIFVLKIASPDLHMWKFQDFSVTLILREINFEESRISKIAIYCNSKGSELCLFGKLQPLKSAKIHENQNSEQLNVLKWQILYF